MDLNWKAAVLCAPVAGESLNRPDESKLSSVRFLLSPLVVLRTPCADLRSACRGECYLAVPLIRLAIRSTPSPAWEKAFIVMRFARNLDVLPQLSQSAKSASRTQLRPVAR